MSCAFNLFNIPENAKDLFDTWIKKISKNDRNLMIVGISAVFWTLWKLRNRVMFDSIRVADPVVPVHLILKNLHDWNILQINPESRMLMMEGVRYLQSVPWLAWS